MYRMNFPCNVRRFCVWIMKNGIDMSTLLFLMSGLLCSQSGNGYYNGIDVSLLSTLTLQDIYLVFLGMYLLIMN